MPTERETTTRSYRIDTELLERFQTYFKARGVQQSKLLEAGMCLLMNLGAVDLEWLMLATDKWMADGCAGAMPEIYDRVRGQGGEPEAAAVVARAKARISQPQSRRRAQ